MPHWGRCAVKDTILWILPWSVWSGVPWVPLQPRSLHLVTSIIGVYVSFPLHLKLICDECSGAKESRWLLNIGGGWDESLNLAVRRFGYQDEALHECNLKKQGGAFGSHWLRVSTTHWSLTTVHSKNSMWRLTQKKLKGKESDFIVSI